MKTESQANVLFLNPDEIEMGPSAERIFFKKYENRIIPSKFIRGHMQKYIYTQTNCITSFIGCRFKKKNESS